MMAMKTLRSKVLSQLVFCSLCLFTGLLSALPTSPIWAANPIGEEIPIPPLDSNGCPFYVEPAINIRKIFGPVRYDTGKSLAEIRKLSKNPHSATDHSDHPVGLSVSRSVFQSYYQYTMTKMPDGMICAQISDLAMTIGCENNTVYIAEEISFGTCSYDEVMNHEEKHVEVDRTIMDLFVPLFEIEIREKLRAIGVKRGYSPVMVEKKVSGSFDDILHSFSERMNAQRNRLQDAVDSVEEYERMSMVCDGEMQAFLRQALRE
jgi:hypothetical protein